MLIKPTEPYHVARKIDLAPVFLTKAEYDALEDPPGSKKYPSIGDNRVIITDVGDVQGLDESYSLNEVKIKGKWLDGKPIYRKTYITHISSTTTFTSFPIDAGFYSSGKRLVRIEAVGFRNDGIIRDLHSNNLNEVNQYDCSHATGLYLNMQDAATPHEWDVYTTVFYTKTTD
jgi:hypothetical protein